MTETQQLLADYARNGSETAFRELVTRYVDLVYSTAVRMVEGDAHRAQDVTQTVFADLARKAAKLSDEIMLGGWLHRHTCHVAANVMRGERRRQQRERTASEMNANEDHSEANLSQIRPVLDEAINQLGPEDRTAILLRFFEKHDLRSVGEELGASENAAQKRVSRALEELRGLLKRRGVALSATALGTVLTAEAVTAAPVGLVVGITTTVLAGAAAGTGVVTSFLEVMTMTKLKAGIIGAIVVAGVATPLVWHQQETQTRLRTENGALHERLGQLERLSAENERLSNLAARTPATQMPSNGPSEELLRLRAEVTRLKADSSAQSRGKGADDATAAAAKSWLERVDRLKERMDRVPGQKIPEMQLLTERDWLNVAKGPLETDNDFRRAMASVRGSSAQKAADVLGPALQQYLKQHDSQFPTDLTQLQPYFQPPIDVGVLQSFVIKPAAAVPRSDLGGDWIITQKGPIDLEYDTATSIGPSGSGATMFKAIQTLQEREELNAALRALDSAKAAFTAANNGKQPSDPLQLAPYVKTAEEQAAFQKISAFQAAKEKAAREKIER